MRSQDNLVCDFFVKTLLALGVGLAVAALL